MQKAAKSAAKAPANWKETIERIIKMRKAKTAPVDTKSPGKLADRKEDADVANYQTLVALMLSPQTRDEATAVAMDKLKEHGLTPKSMQEIAETDLAALIHNVSFYRNKAKYIKKTTDIIADKYKGKVPDTLKSLLALPGVGKKIAHLTLQICYKKCEGIAVDTHVHRISNRLGWVKSRKPEETEAQLEKWLPKTWWEKVNVLLVGFGQEICRPIGPKCGECEALEFCPFGQENIKKPSAAERRRANKRTHSKVRGSASEPSKARSSPASDI